MIESTFTVDFNAMVKSPSLNHERLDFILATIMCKVSPLPYVLRTKVFTTNYQDLGELSG